MIKIQEGYKYLHVMYMLYITILVAGNVLAYKIVLIGSIPLRGSTLIYTITFFLTDVITEVYGYSAARKLIWTSLFCDFIFDSVITLVNFLPSPSWWSHTHEYNQVIGHLMRFFIAGAMGYLTSAFLNAYLVSKLKIFMKGKHFWIRSLGATILSELTANFIACAISFLGIFSIVHIFTIVLSDASFKIVYDFVLICPTTLLAIILKKKEANIYDYNVNFSPFVLEG